VGGRLGVLGLVLGCPRPREPSHCLINDHPEIGRGFDMAREHGVVILDDDTPRAGDTELPEGLTLVCLQRALDSGRREALSSATNSSAQARRRSRIARNVLGTTRRFTVRVAEMPALPRLNEPAYELAVDQLRPPAGSPSSTPHPAGRDGWSQASPRTAMLRTRVLPVDGRPGEIAASPRAEPCMRGERLELSAAVVAAASAEGHPPEDAADCPAGSFALGAEGLVSMAWVEPARTS
jgi:hypothetical protein